MLSGLRNMRIAECVFLVFSLLFVGCAAGGGSVCVPGTTQSCACPGGVSGVQTCNATGSGYGSCLMCPPATQDAGPPACVPNESRACPCASGGMGIQTCNASGSGYGACGSCPRCGDGRCDASETCASCAMDCAAVMSCARCGDGTCNGAENPTNCPGDCQRASTPRCGDGVCATPTESCVDCPDDCMPCPPRCGDGVCNDATGETCATCRMDCIDRCETTCMPCAQNSDCPSNICLVRRCDGVRGCYPTLDAGCAIIGGVRCPATAAYNLCIGNAECGPYATCTRFGDGRATCIRRCTSDADCPSPPDGSTTTEVCDPTNRLCYLRCTGPGTCPYGLSCFRYSNGMYGFCS